MSDRRLIFTLPNNKDMTTTTDTTKAIAAETLRQLGGRQFLAMTGSNNLTCSADGDNVTLTMHLRANKARAKYLQITLTVMDVYTVEFFKMDRAYNRIEIAKHENVYGDMLADIFTEVTGLYTSL